MTQLHNVISPHFSRYLLESLPDGVFTLDSEGRITSWNPAMERISGYSVDEVLGRHCTLLKFDQCYGQQCPKGVKECGIYRQGVVDSKECHIEHKDGFKVPVLKSARLVKDDNGKVLGIVETLADLTELHETRRRMEEANRRLGDIHSFDNIIGKSKEMQAVFFALKAAAASEATVLIEGESGTGKELVAGAINFNSIRADKPFVIVNCSALSEPLLESELFGHVKGAFTGAIQNRRGRFEEASGGTIFLDEIGEVSPYIQIKLLRVLQEREIERVGDSVRQKVDIRIIAATNKRLYELVQAGRFREDLYYRLKVFPIQVPPLRERKEDVPLLATYFNRLQRQKTGKKIEGFTHQAMRILMDYSWPGNVRELENAIEYAFVICAGKHIDVAELPQELRESHRYSDHGERTSVPPSPESVQSVRMKRKLRKTRLLELLKECEWNKAEVARRIGISRTTVWYYMKKWKIPLNEIDLEN